MLCSGRYVLAWRARCAIPPFKTIHQMVEKSLTKSCHFPQGRIPIITRAAVVYNSHDFDFPSCENFVRFHIFIFHRIQDGSKFPHPLSITPTKGVRSRVLRLWSVTPLPLPALPTWAWSLKTVTTGSALWRPARRAPWTTGCAMPWRSMSTGEMEGECPSDLMTPLIDFCDLWARRRNRTQSSLECIEGSMVFGW